MQYTLLEPVKGQEKRAKPGDLRQNTSYYIATYLSPNERWREEITVKQRLNLLRFSEVNWTDVARHIQGMEYKDFLVTPYWKAIAMHTKYKAGFRCQLCNSRGHLVTHHRNYGIHGREHEYMNDLIALCSLCHDKFHSIEAPLRRERSPSSRKGARRGSRTLWSLLILLVLYFFF